MRCSASLQGNRLLRRIAKPSLYNAFEKLGSIDDGRHMKKEEGSVGNRGSQARGTTIKAEIARGAGRKIPKKALVGAVVGLLLCVVVIVAVAIAFGGSKGAVSLDAQDIPALAAVDGDEVVFDDPIDESQVVYLQIGNYPSLNFDPPGTALASDRDLIERACSLLSGARFVRWGGYAQYQEKQSKMDGGYFSSLTLVNGDREALATILYNPAIVIEGGAPGEGISLYIGELCCVMDGDQSAIEDFIEECVLSALSEYEDEAGGAYFEFDPSVSHTWVPREDIDVYEAQREALTSEDAATSTTGEVLEVAAATNGAA